MARGNARRAEAMARGNALRAKQRARDVGNSTSPADDGACSSVSSSTDACRAANLQLAHNVELNRQCVNQTWQRIERAAWRGTARPIAAVMQFDDELPANQDGAFSSELYFRRHGRGGPGGRTDVAISNKGQVLMCPLNGTCTLAWGPILP